MKLSAIYRPGLLVAFLAAAVPASAQDQPAPFPWERQVDQFQKGPTANPLFRPYRPANPLASQQRRLQRGLRALGLPENPSPNPGTGSRGTPSAPLDLTAYERLDPNRDGTITRQEYFQNRLRSIPVGPRGERQRQRTLQRMIARFRGADTNRDGRVSVEELQSLRNPRF